MKYRVKETQITDTYSEFSIEQRIFFMWFAVGVHSKYLASLEEARKWIILKQKGYPVTSYYYER